MSGENNAGGLTTAEQLNEQFRQFAGGAAETVWRSPGRVNLIGEHTDYNDGLALPFAIDRATFVANRRRPGSLVRVWSANLDKQVTANLDDVASWDPSLFESWARYPLGVIWAFHQKGADIPGTDIAISSNVPLGSGLSSSAALTVAVALAADDLAGTRFDAREIALLSQQAESSFAGVPCGLLDQTAVLEGKAGHAVLIDFLSMETELVPFGTGPVVILDTRVERDNASGAYAERRAACQKAAEMLGLRSLREANLELVEHELAGDIRKRARHVVTENDRVAQAASRLRARHPIGDLLVASHLSLAQDYEVSCPELDLAVGTALATGAAGARLTGAGLGGCAIALGIRAEELAGPTVEAFAAAGFRRPRMYEVTPSDGAGRVP